MIVAKQDKGLLSSGMFNPTHLYILKSFDTENAELYL